MAGGPRGPGLRTPVFSLGGAGLPLPHTCPLFGSQVGILSGLHLTFWGPGPCLSPPQIKAEDPSSDSAPAAPLPPQPAQPHLPQAQLMLTGSQLAGVSTWGARGQGQASPLPSVTGLVAWGVPPGPRPRPLSQRLPLALLCPPGRPAP